MKRSSLQLKPTEVFPVYEFRPLPGYFSGEVRRYNNGNWIVDDGETYDICFIGMVNGVEDFSKRPFKFHGALYFNHKYRPNIVYSWCSGHWSSREPRHPNGNAWHYALKPGTTEWGDSWQRGLHPNERASRNGMDKVCAEHGCANGVSIELTNRDKHIVAGLVRNAETKEMLTIPTDVKCMYCGDTPTREKPNEK